MCDNLLFRMSEIILIEEILMYKIRSGILIWSTNKGKIAIIPLQLLLRL